MKNIFKTVSLLIVIGAIVGAVILVQKNQETRRGAAMAESSVSILPATLNTKVGNKPSFRILVNTGNDSDLLSAADLRFSFSSDKLKFVSFEPNNGFEAINKQIEVSEGKLVLNLVKLAKGKGGAINVGKFNFEIIGLGEGKISLLPESNIMVSGQNSLWPIPKPAVSVITIKGSGLEPEKKVNCGWCGRSCVSDKNDKVCPMIAPLPGSSCVNKDNVCTIVNDEVTMIPTATSCVPRPACMDGIVDAKGNKVYCDPRPGMVYCPQEVGVVKEGDLCGGLQNIVCAKGLYCDRTGTDKNMVSIPEGAGVCKVDLSI